MNIGDHQGIPRTDFAARKKSPALAKLATNSWLDKGCCSQAIKQIPSSAAMHSPMKQMARVLPIWDFWRSDSM
jgi:hypothetical protein